MMFPPSCQLLIPLPTAHRGVEGDLQATANMEGERNKINHMTQPTGGVGGGNQPHGGGVAVNPGTYMKLRSLRTKSAASVSAMLKTAFILRLRFRTDA